MKVLVVAGRRTFADPAPGEHREAAEAVTALRGLGHDAWLFDPFGGVAHADYAALNIAFVDAVVREAPAVVILLRQSHEIWIESLELVRSASSAALVHWGTEDVRTYARFTRYVAPWLDCCATTSAETLAIAHRDGHANFARVQWAASDTALAEPLPAARCRHRVSFVGAASGPRRRWIANLARHGVAVECFGPGWANGPIAPEDAHRVFRESLVSLDFAERALVWRGAVPRRTGRATHRVFEVPGAGGLLLTERAPGLEQLFRIGEEIDVFDDAASLAARIQHYLAHPTERDRIARAGHARIRAEHTLAARLTTLLADGIAARARLRPDAPAEPRVAAADAGLARLVATYRPSGVMRLAGSALSRSLALALGARRGRRLARQLVWEFSWRFLGERTYTTAGLPGRLFHEER